jgi:glycosyltransferase involved in cell wall biosynthesis
MKKQLSLRTILTKLKFKLRGGILTYRPVGTSKGRVLLSHDKTPFVNPELSLNTHANYWTAVEMVKIFNEKGYTVDVIDNNDRTFVPKKHYAYFVVLEQNMDHIAPLLNADCVKILHIVGAHWLFQNTAEYTRCLELQRRKKKTIMPQRLIRPTYAIEHADCATMIGNKFTADTYAFANKKIYSTPLPCAYEYPFPEDKDFDASRKNFLWFGGAGAVHKGLDLVLEAFAQMPEYNLTVFGKSTTDEKFMEAYRKELTETPNIKAMGYVNFDDGSFEKTRYETNALVYPSCSEGTSGSAVMSLHGGVLPIVSYESGLDTEDFGTLLKENTVEAIMQAVHELANLPTEELKRRARAGWEFARKNHSRENFTNKYRAFVEELERGAHSHA